MKSANQKERELIIKLSNERKSCRDIASLLAISKSKVSFWINRFKKTGKLEDKPRNGRPTPLTKEKINSIKQKIRFKIQEHSKIKKAGINSKEVMDIVKTETDVTYTLRHIQRLLHKMGLSLITPRVSHIKKDKKAQEKFRCEFKKNLSRNMWVIQS